MSAKYGAPRRLQGQIRSVLRQKANKKGGRTAGEGEGGSTKQNPGRGQETETSAAGKMSLYSEKSSRHDPGIAEGERGRERTL